MQHICIFEDSQNSQLIPLVYTKAVFELRCGLFTALGRAMRYYPNAAITLLCRDYLCDVLKERYPYPVNHLPPTNDTYLFLNGRTLLSSPIPVEGSEEIGIQDGILIYARLRGENIKRVSPEMFLAKESVELLKDVIPVVEIEVPVIHYFWDIIKYNRSGIERDFAQFIKKGSVSGEICDGAYLINKDQIFIGKDSRIKPCSVLDAEKGPIYIGDHVTIAPNTTIEGPACIGDYTVVQPNSRLRSGTNTGELCKVGGEISNTIFHSYSNKQHDGFLGDSYIGSWANIGANTVNSNLLNTYGNVRVEFNGNILNTNHMFLGMAMGDHTKTAINTMIMTGSIFGFGCNIITTAYPPKYLPSFTWYSNNGMSTYTLEKALNVAKIVMKRRDKEMSQSEEHLFRVVFLLTEEERNSYSLV